MSRSIPIRDLAGKIIGLRAAGDEPDPVQQTLEASLKAIGASPQPQAAQSPKRDVIAIPSPLRIVIGALLVCVWVVSLVLLAGRSQPAPRSAPAPVATTTPTRTPTATIRPTALPPTPTEQPVPPTPVPAPAEPPPQALPPPAAPALIFCSDRESIWGRTHQCATSQAEADALADAEIGRINAEGEAKSKLH